jgi:ABC-2 type transport system ATP-binding protein
MRYKIASNTYAIETRNLTKRFRKTRSLREILFRPFGEKEIVTALRDVSIKVKKGEIFGLLGPNGAGKTTLIKLLCTLILSDEGEAFVNGMEITSNVSEVKSNIGYVVADERSFYWRLTGRQNLSFFSTLQNLSAPGAESRIRDVLKIVELEDEADKRFMLYSAGMKQRLAIARALLNDPSLLFMDEPTKSLDPLSARHLRTFIKERIVTEKKKTIFLATHNLQEARELCNRMAIIDRGEIKAIGSLEEMKGISGYHQKYIIKLNADADSMNTLKGILTRRNLAWKSSESLTGDLIFEFKSDNGKSDITGLVREIVMAGAEVLSFYPLESSLDDIFTYFFDKDREV